AVVADVRWYLDGRSGRDAFESGHLPGAVFVDLHEVLAAHGLAPELGRHPLPNPEAFAAAMGALGIGDDSTVVAYDDTGGMTAGRLVVMLRMIGRNAAVLDGGLAQYHGELMTGPGTPREPLPFTPCAWPADRLADADETVALARSGAGLVLDARSHGRFTGEVVAVDPRPGHVPGATSAPWEATLDPATGRFKPAPELRDHFNALGVSGSSNVVTYCGSGVSACMNIIAMEHAGLPPARLFVASFSGWSADPAREVELGPGR
ncbi:MAG TPA: sulfurtransferase, partial [Ilumatobacteraceae bacterium]